MKEMNITGVGVRRICLVESIKVRNSQSADPIAGLTNAKDFLRHIVESACALHDHDASRNLVPLVCLCPRKDLMSPSTDAMSRKS